MPRTPIRSCSESVDLEKKQLELRPWAVFKAAIGIIDNRKFELVRAKVMSVAKRHESKGLEVLKSDAGGFFLETDLVAKLSDIKSSRCIELARICAISYLEQRARRLGREKAKEKDLQLHILQEFTQAKLDSSQSSDPRTPISSSQPSNSPSALFSSQEANCTSPSPSAPKNQSLSQLLASNLEAQSQKTRNQKFTLSSHNKENIDTKSTRLMLPPATPAKFRPLTPTKITDYETEENAMAVRDFLKDCVPSMEYLYPNFIDYGCNSRELLLIISQWPDDELIKQLHKIAAKSNDVLSDMYADILVKHLRVYAGLA